MAAGDDEHRDGPSVPSLFDDRPADETRVNPIPPPAPAGGRRVPIEPPGSPGPAPASWPSSDPYDQRYGAPSPGPDPGDPFAGAANTGSRPRILANQAGDWEQNLQEVEVVRSSRTGLIALFVLALIVVAVIALGLAAWSVLNGGDDDPIATGDETATETTDEAAGDATTPTSTPDTTTVDTTAAAPAFDPATDLRVTVVEDPFVCDGGTREFALLGNADPDENVSFVSPQADALRSGVADANGELPIRWQCDPTQAGTTWELTATGETSGRSATFLFAGVTAGASTDQPDTSDPAVPAPTELTVEVLENPYVCDGEVRVFAQLSGADPNESVAFSSPQSEGLRPGMADEAGRLPIRWQCDPTQVGTTWELTATGETSGRTTTFSFVGG